MKIVDRKEFLKYPENTLFLKFEPDWFGELSIKGESLTNDFLYQQVGDAIESSGSEDLSNKLNKALEGMELDFDFYCQSRDGLFDDAQLFAVLNKTDVAKLIKRLAECL